MSVPERDDGLALKQPVGTGPANVLVFRSAWVLYQDEQSSFLNDSFILNP